MGQTALHFLGTSSCRTDVGNDTASYLIDGRLMIDTGWDCVQNIRTMGLEPTDVECLLFTHLHHDHYLSLPSFLFYWLCMEKPLDRLTLAGPAEDLARVAAYALDFLQVSTFFPHQSAPTLRPLVPGAVLQAADCQIKCYPARHPVPALCYRIACPGGQALGFSGDTCYMPELAEYFRGCDALVHECSLGPEIADRAANEKMLHSSARDAGRVAREAGASQLILTHGSTRTRSECIQAARQEYDGPVCWPERGETFIFCS